MSYFDDASLVMIPSGYKTSKVYSVKPTDGSGDLDFTRTGDTATRVNSAGLIEKVRTNLNIYSSDFGNAVYFTTEATRTTGQSDPFGTSTATRFLETTATDNHGVFFVFYNPPSTGEVTQSVYVKDNGRGAVNFSQASRTIGFVFTFSTETISNVIGSPIAYSATSVGNGWYRLSLTFLVAAGSPINHTFVEGYNGSTITYAGDVTKGFIVAAAQLEYNAGASPYIATNGSAVSVGPVANVPRLDYLGSTCPRLLLEPQRTNLVTYSEQFDNAAWNKSASSVTANNAISPDGYTNADLLTSSGPAGYLFPANTNILGAAGGGTFAYSVYLKAGTASSITLLISAVATYTAVFNLSNGTATTSTANTTASIISVGNGWYRCIIVCSSVANSAYSELQIGRVASGLTFYVWGAQLEAGAYATSYIPTLAASATRGADACSKTGISSLIGQTEGTLFAEFKFNSTNFSKILLFASVAGSYANAIYIQTFSSNGVSMQVWSGGVSQVAIDFTGLTNGQTVKMAAAYKGNDFAFYVNGTQAGTDTSGTVPSGLSQIEVGSYAEAGAPFAFNEAVNQALLFKTRLSNADLAALTA